MSGKNYSGTGVQYVHGRTKDVVLDTVPENGSAVIGLRGDVEGSIEVVDMADATRDITAYMLKTQVFEVKKVTAVTTLTVDNLFWGL